MNTKKIKILFRHRSMEMGGVEKVMLSLLNNLDKEKFDMTVLMSLNQGELRNEFPHHVRKIYLVDGKEDLSTNPVLQKIQLFPSDPVHHDDRSDAIQEGRLEV